MRLPVRWYSVLLIPPSVILIVPLSKKAFVSPISYRQLSGGHKLWNPCRVFRGDWLDRLCDCQDCPDK